ncbi:MAG: winged helix-turn-helix domain-containing protein [Pseudomonadota bacterium]
MKQSDKPSFSVTIGVHSFDLSSRELRNSAGAPVALRAKSAQLLRALASRPGRMIPKSALMDAVWGDVNVTEESLTKCARDIRLALGADADCLETVPRQGFRLEASAIAAPDAGTAKLYVTPLDNLTGGSRWDRIAKGLAGQIANNLDVDPWFMVLLGPATSESGLVLSGEVLAQDARVRILLRLSDGSHVLWSDSRDFPEGELFAMIDEMSARATAALSRVWTGPHFPKLSRKAKRKPADQLNTFENWLIATEFILNFTLDHVRGAKDYIGRALDTDEDFLPAWGSLATFHQILMNSETTRAARSDHQRAHAKTFRRLEVLDPEGVQTLLHGGFLAALDGKLEEAYARVDHIVATRPSSLDLVARCMIFAGHWDWLGPRAEDWRGRLRQGPCAHPVHQHALGVAAYHLGDCRTAYQTMRRQAFPLSHTLLMLSAAVRLGESDATEQATQIWHENVPADLKVEELLSRIGAQGRFRDQLLSDVEMVLHPS